MTPKKLINDIIKKKDRVNFTSMIVIIAIASSTSYFDSYMISIIGILGAVLFACIVNHIANTIILDKVDEDVAKDNYELSTIILERKMILPSRIKPILEKMSEEQK